MKKLIPITLLLYSAFSIADIPSSESWTVMKDKDEFTDEIKVSALTLDEKTGDIILLMCRDNTTYLAITQGAYSVESNKYWTKVRVDSNESFESLAWSAPHERYHLLAVGSTILGSFMTGESAIIQTTGWKNEKVTSKITLNKFYESLMEVSDSCEERESN